MRFLVGRPCSFDREDHTAVHFWPYGEIERRGHIEGGASRWHQPFHRLRQPSSRFIVSSFHPPQLKVKCWLKSAVSDQPRPEPTRGASDPPAARSPAPRRPVCTTPACTTPAACPTRARHVRLHRRIASGRYAIAYRLPLKAPQPSHDLSQPPPRVPQKHNPLSCHPARSEPPPSATAAPYQHRRSTSHLGTTWASPHTWARGLGLKPERCRRSPD